MTTDIEIPQDILEAFNKKFHLVFKSTGYSEEFCGVDYKSTNDDPLFTAYLFRVINITFRFPLELQAPTTDDLRVAFGSALAAIEVEIAPCPKEHTIIIWRMSPTLIKGQLIISRLGWIKTNKDPP